MYLTRMYLNGARRGARNLLGSPQRMHAAVMSAFPPDAHTGDETGRVLWRVDRAPNTTTLYVASPTKPDLTHVVEQAGWPSGADPWQTADLEPFLDRLRSGQQWVFRLTANPARSLRNPGGRGIVRAHVTVSQQENWLRDRAKGWGFEPESVSVNGRGHASFGRHTGGTSSKVTVATATYDGVLAVTDADLLRTALRAGVGRAKAYGCGLITLAPLS